MAANSPQPLLFPGGLSVPSGGGLVASHLLLQASSPGLCCCSAAAALPCVVAAFAPGAHPDLPQGRHHLPSLQKPLQVLSPYKIIKHY